MVPDNGEGAREDIEGVPGEDLTFNKLSCVFIVKLLERGCCSSCQLGWTQSTEDGRPSWISEAYFPKIARAFYFCVVFPIDIICPKNPGFHIASDGLQVIQVFHLTQARRLVRGWPAKDGQEIVREASRRGLR